MWKYYRRRLWAVWVVFLLLAFQATLELMLPYYMGVLTDFIADTVVIGSGTLKEGLDYLMIIAVIGVSFHVSNKLTHSFYDWNIKCPAMRDSGIDVFAQVQRFSLDWHSNSFAGAVVTKIKRGMSSVERFGDSFLLSILASVNKSLTKEFKRLAPLRNLSIFK